MLLDRGPQREERHVALQGKQHGEDHRGRWEEDEPSGHARLRRQEQEGEEAAEDEHVALGEIENAARGMDDVVAHSDEREDRAEPEAANEDDRQLFHRHEAGETGSRSTLMRRAPAIRVGSALRSLLDATLP